VTAQDSTAVSAAVSCDSVDCLHSIRLHVSTELYLALCCTRFAFVHSKFYVCMYVYRLLLE